MPIEKRTGRIALRIFGPDAQAFLHDLITARVSADESGGRWWALLSAQGKVQAEGLIGAFEGAFWLDIAAEVRESFVKRLRLYKLRAQVEVEDLSDTHMVGHATKPVPGVVCHPDLRHDALGFRVIAPKDQTSEWADPAPGTGAYTKARVDHGLVEMPADFAADSQFPHDLGMDLLGGVDFKKGCYVGQEVVSRMQHRGTARKRPVQVVGDHLTPGVALSVQGRAIGTLGTVAGRKGVAIVRIDRVGASGEAECDGTPVKLVVPNWASYAFGDSSGSDSD